MRRYGSGREFRMRESSRRGDRVVRRWAMAVLAGVVVVGWAAAGAAKKESVDYATPSDIALKTLLVDVARAGDRLVAVGEWGHVMLSDDGGESWRQARSVPTQVTLTEVTFADARQGWAVGHDAVVLHTRDGGETWELQYSDPENEGMLFSVWFEDAEHGIVVGCFGTMLETRDGGEHWEERPPLEFEDEGPHLNHIFAGPDGVLFIAAEFGSAFRSRDKGQTWEHLDVPYDGSLWGGLALDGGEILIFGMRGHAFRSADLGESWEAVETGTNQSLQDAVRLGDGKIVMVGLGGVVTTSTDGGQTFQAAIEPDRRGIASVAEGADGMLLLFGESGLKKRPQDVAESAPSPQS